MASVVAVCQQRYARITLSSAWLAWRSYVAYKKTGRKMRHGACCIETKADSKDQLIGQLSGIQIQNMNDSDPDRYRQPRDRMKLCCQPEV
jgi:hypothetical protein